MKEPNQGPPRFARECKFGPGFSPLRIELMNPWDPRKPPGLKFQVIKLLCPPPAPQTRFQFLVQVGGGELRCCVWGAGGGGGSPKYCLTQRVGGRYFWVASRPFVSSREVFFRSSCVLLFAFLPGWLLATCYGTRKKKHAKPTTLSPP